MRRLGPLYGGAVALVHSTPWRWPDAVGDEARSSAWVVALGLPVGLAAWAAGAAAHGLGLSVVIGALVGLFALSLANALLVERGLGERIERAYDGNAAAIVLVFVTLVRVAAFLALPERRWFGILVTTAVVGRWAAVFLQAIGDPIVDDPAPRSLVATPSPAWLTGALGIAVAVLAVVALGQAGLLVIILAAVGAFVLGLVAQRRERGLSAPVVACAAAFGELCVLLVASATV
jgi:cobalamin synthase